LARVFGIRDDRLTQDHFATKVKRRLSQELGYPFPSI
jgi:hypothetical protein